MLESTTAGSQSKALNGLSFPFTAPYRRSCFDDNPSASCRAAWNNTHGSLFRQDEATPLGEVHWGLAATEGAMTLWHIDSDGLGTTVDVRAGEKLWFIGSDERKKFNHIGVFLSKKFELDAPPRGFSTEAILLTPKTRL